MDKLVSIKGLVIRATPIIPDMKEGMLYSSPWHVEARLTPYSLFPLPDVQSLGSGGH